MTSHTWLRTGHSGGSWLRVVLHTITVLDRNDNNIHVCVRLGRRASGSVLCCVRLGRRASGSVFLYSTWLTRLPSFFNRRDSGSSATSIFDPFIFFSNSSWYFTYTRAQFPFQLHLSTTRGQSNLTKSASRGAHSRLGVTPGGRNLYHWIPGVGFPIRVP